MGFSRGWKEQKLVRRDEIHAVLLGLLKIVNHDLPKGAGGQLYVVGGIAETADEIMNLLELRAKEEREKAEKSKTEQE